MPPVHRAHAVDPVEDDILPVPHTRQVDNPLASEYVPTAQGAQPDAAKELYVPG